MYKLCALNLHVFPCTKTMFHGLTVNVHTCIHCLYVQLYFSRMYLVHVCVHYVFLFVVITCFASKGHHISSCNIWWAIFLIGGQCRICIMIFGAHDSPFLPPWITGNISWGETKCQVLCNVFVFMKTSGRLYYYHYEKKCHIFEFLI